MLCDRKSKFYCMMGWALLYTIAAVNMP